MASQVRSHNESRTLFIGFCEKTGRKLPDYRNYDFLRKEILAYLMESQLDEQDLERVFVNESTRIGEAIFKTNEAADRVLEGFYGRKILKYSFWVGKQMPVVQSRSTRPKSNRSKDISVEPKASRSTSTKPKASQSTSAKPKASQSTPAKPKASRSTFATSKASQSAHAKPKASQSKPKALQNKPKSLQIPPSMSKQATIDSICCAPAIQTDNVSYEPAIGTGIVEECIQCRVEVMLYLLYKFNSPEFETIRRLVLPVHILEKKGEIYLSGTSTHIQEATRKILGSQLLNGLNLELVHVKGCLSKVQKKVSSMPYPDLGYVFYHTNDDKSYDVLLFSTNWDEFEAASKLLAVSYNCIMIESE